MRDTGPGGMCPDVQVTFVPNIPSAEGQLHRIFALFAEDLQDKILVALRGALNGGMDHDH